MYKIVVGTTSNQKIKYLKEFLNEINVKYEIISSDVESGVASFITSFLLFMDNILSNLMDYLIPLDCHIY